MSQRPTPGYAISDTLLSLRDLLYCDLSLEKALSGLRTQEPLLQEAVAALDGRRFAHARALLEDSTARLLYGQVAFYWLILAKARWMDGDLPGARDAVLHTLAVPSLGARDKLQAWAIWRELGYFPDQRDADRVFGVIVEMALEKGLVMVAGYADGDARMVWTTGGGLLGPMRDPVVVEAAKAATRVAEPLTALLRLDLARPLPARGRVRFAVLTPAGMYTAEEAESSLRQPSHRLYPTYLAMHRLLNSLVRVYEEKKEEAS